MERTFDVLSVWRPRAAKVNGGALPCGHYLPEEAPEETSDGLFHRLRLPSAPVC